MDNNSSNKITTTHLNFSDLTSESIAVYEEGKIVTCNTHFVKSFGFSKLEEVIGLSLFHFFPKIYREILSSDKTESTLDTMCVRNDSSTFPAVVIVKKLQLNGLNIKAVVVRDETERKQSENQLLRSAVFERAVLDSANFAIITTDFNGLIKTFNKGAENMFGHTSTKVINKMKLPALFQKKDNEKHRALLSKELNKEISNDFECFIGRLQTLQSDEQERAGLKKDNSKIVSTVTATTLKDHLDEVNGYLFTCIDISEKKISEKKLEASARSLQKINKELDQFAYIVSHDLKAPLRAISNLSLWIEEDVGDSLDEDSRKNLALMRDRVQRMQNLIDGILSYSRIGRIKADSEKIDVGSLIREVTEVIAIPESFKVNIPENLPVILFNKTWLEQVFTNLLSNAVKYHHKKEGTIWIDYKDENDWHLFSIADDGPGIDPEYHEKIFLIFQTLESKDKIESTGIGLTIVKKIIEEHGGEIWVESDGQSGSRFSFTIPKTIVLNTSKID